MLLGNIHRYFFGRESRSAQGIFNETLGISKEFTRGYVAYLCILQSLKQTSRSYVAYSRNATYAEHCRFTETTPAQNAPAGVF